MIALWLIARANGAPLPRRLVYVVDRRAVVDQATEVAEKLRKALEENGSAAALRAGLGLSDKANLAISTLRGQFADNREWQADPAAPAIIIGTVDMIGSRLLFEGYGVSRGMRPFHAGLLGVDTLIVLDEAHLVPPFEKLIEQIETGAEIYGPKAETDRALIPPLRLMSLSATSGGRKGVVFRLTEPDNDTVTSKRLTASKSLVFIAPTAEKLEARLAAEAWALSDEGNAAIRVIVFCNSRDIAEKAHNALTDHARAKKIEIETELFVGARRVREREAAKERLKSLGFIAGGETPTKPCFLVATSAGEVGVDLDADHLVCDLAPYERMVQRFGRVNRRGERSDTKIVVIVEPAPVPKKADAPTDQEEAQLDRYARAQDSKSLLERLRGCGDSRDANPGALMQLKETVGAGAIAEAFTPAPLHPALNRALVDAWSMTSLAEHTGRPEVAPWLRGWVDEEPQTTMIWRTHLPAMADGEAFSDRDVEAFFESAPPSTNERLETETWRVLDWLKKRVMARTDPVYSKTAGSRDFFGFVLEQSGDLRRTLKLSDFENFDKKNSDRAWEQVKSEITGRVLIVSSAMAGLRDGLLDEKANDPPACGDTDTQFATGFAVQVVTENNAAQRVSFARPMKESEESEAPSQWLIVQRGAEEDGKAIAKNVQLLDEHQDWARKAARFIGERLSLPAPIASAIETAARLHDEGKRAANWQRAFRAPRNGVYGKTKGPIDHSLLDGYRHEFGSLPFAMANYDFKRLNPDLQDLVLHLIAAHHGNARPVIETRGCEDGPQSVLQDRARDVAVRFARLQKRFGPWGLAWLEALVRAADQQASRRLETDADG
jgi:CRISPR-associated endonuclease/helicase Cas3